MDGVDTMKARYWVLSANGDPISQIGSGFRQVDVEIGSKMIRLVGHLPELTSTLTPKEWDDLPHILVDKEMSLAVVLGTLRNYHTRPCQNKETCDV